MNKVIPAPGARLSILLLLFATLPCGCSTYCVFDISGAHSLSLRLPALPEAWRSLPGIVFLVSWRDAKGFPASAYADPESVLEIAVERGLPQYILAEPRFANGALKPAGALYPGERRPESEYRPLSPAAFGRDELTLSWIGGYCAAAARALDKAAVDFSAFDLATLGREAAERRLDPWGFPADEAARRLAAGTFRADMLRDTKRYPITLPEGLLWIHESPFAEAVVDDMIELSAGIHRFVGHASELIVSVDEEGDSVWVKLPRSIILLE